MAQDRAQSARNYIDALLAFYVADNRNNPTGKNIRDWTGDDWRLAESADLMTLRSAIAGGDPAVWDLVPNHLRQGRTEGEARSLFHAMILNESQRRNDLGALPERFVNEGISIRFNVPVDDVDVDTPITVQRGGLVVNEIYENGRPTGRLEFTDMPVRTITAQPEDIISRDMAADVIENRFNPAQRGRVTLRADVYEAVRRNTGGLPEGGIQITGGLSDQALFDLGYSMAGDQELINLMPLEVNVSRQVYSVLPQLTARIGAGIDVPDDQAFVAGIIAGSIARNHPDQVSDTVIYPPR